MGLSVVLSLAPREESYFRSQRKSREAHACTLWTGTHTNTVIHIFALTHILSHTYIHIPTSIDIYTLNTHRYIKYTPACTAAATRIKNKGWAIPSTAVRNIKYIRVIHRVIHWLDIGGAQALQLQQNTVECRRVTKTPDKDVYTSPCNTWNVSICDDMFCWGFP